MVGLDSKKFKPTWALEIKWSNRFFDKPSELKSLQQFCEKNNLKSALVTTVDKEGNIRYKDIDYTFLPAAMYAYVVGLNTLKLKPLMTESDE